MKEGKSSNQGAKAFPIEAGSWGGKVRSGPGTNYKQIGSLKNGDVVQLLENTREMMDGYPWFKIQHGDGKVGYQHGSILCAYDQEMKGIYSICEIDNRPQKASEITSQASSEIKGCSCGGKVRSGPGSNNKQIGSLSNGAPIYLLEREKIENCLESFYRSASSLVFQLNKRHITRHMSIFRCVDRRFETGEIFVKWDESIDNNWLLLIYIKNNSPDEGIIIEDKSNPEKNITHELKTNEIFKASDLMVDSLTQLLAKEREKNKQS